VRAFPVLHARDVEALAAFYMLLGFAEEVRLPGPGGAAGYIGLRRDAAELAITTQDAPRQLAGVEPGPGPRGELYVHVEDVDAAVAMLRDAGAHVHRQATAMPWGERVAYLADPEGNLVTLAAAPAAL
jgi:lactoylglutathione lyase